MYQQDKLKPRVLLQAKYKSARIIGAYRLTAQETNLITLGAETAWREVGRPPPSPPYSDWLWFKWLSSPWQTALEVLKGRAIPISLWILIGSVIGGLLLLALIIFVLWKVLIGPDCSQTGHGGGDSWSE